jgi:hypothetical protein
MKTLAFILAPLALAAVVVSPLPAQKVLPEHFGKWKSGPGPVDEPKFVPPDSPLLREAGQMGVEVERYTDGKQWIRVWLQEFHDPTGAYQAYTSKLKVGMNASTVGPLTATADDQIVAQVGNRVLTISNVHAASNTDLQLLLHSARQHADGTPLPPIRSYLPDEGMVQGTQRYALGPAGFDAALASLNESKLSPLAAEIGFAAGAEAMVANYHVAPNKSQSLLIIAYPTPQFAEQRLRHIESLLAANPRLAGTSVERRASLLSMVLSPVSAQSAARLREAITYGTNVTWSEPSQTLTDPPWLVVVKDIFVGTLAFCGIAIVLGIAFGGLRVLTKRLFPGKVFDRPEDMEVLQLGLSGKRIDPRDFY